MKYNYTKYSEWRWYLLLISLILGILLIIFALTSKNEKWTKAAFIESNNIHVVCFNSNDDYEEWKKQKYSYLKCIVNNHFYSLQINQSISINKNDYFKNSIFIDANENEIKVLTKNSTISVFIENIQWFSYFFTHIF